MKVARCLTRAKWLKASSNQGISIDSLERILAIDF